MKFKKILGSCFGKFGKNYEETWKKFRKYFGKF